MVHIQVTILVGASGQTLRTNDNNAIGLVLIGDGEFRIFARAVGGFEVNRFSEEVFVIAIWICTGKHHILSRGNMPDRIIVIRGFGDVPNGIGVCIGAISGQVRVTISDMTDKDIEIKVVGGRVVVSDGKRSEFIRIILISL